MTEQEIATIARDEIKVQQLVAACAADAEDGNNKRIFDNSANDAEHFADLAADAAG